MIDPGPAMTTIPVAFFVLACAVAPPAGAQTAASTPVLVTHGEATIRRAPDRAWLTVSTETRDVRAADARQKNADAMTAAQNALKGAGVPPDAIRTMAVSVTPEMDWNNGRSTLRGYVARNQVEVRVDNLDKLSDTIDAVNAAKGVALTIAGPRFDLRDPRAAQAEALRAAVEDATARAQAMALGARRSVGPIVRIEDLNAGRMPQPVPFMAARTAMAAEPATPVTPGEIDVHAEVQITFELR